MTQLDAGRGSQYTLLDRQRRSNLKFPDQEPGSIELLESSHRNDESGSRALTIYAVSFLSGVAALTYELSWARQFGILFGYTVQAAAIVVAAYFAGMAIGYALAGRLRSPTPPLLGLAAAQLVIAIWAFAIPLLLEALLTGAPAPVWNLASTGLRTGARAATSFLLMLPATVAMGVTLPLLAEQVSPGHRLNARRATITYAFNTFGAVVGTILATGYLILELGVRSSSYAAALISIACGVAAYALHVSLRTSRSRLSQRLPERLAAEDGPGTGRIHLWTGIAAISGFATLGLEVLYLQLFALVFHNSTYTFGAVVAIFLAALALGAAAVSLLESRVRADRLASFASLTGSIAVLGSVLAFLQLTGLKYFTFGDGFLEYLLGVFGLVALTVLPPITLLGVVLPTAWKALEASVAPGAATVGRLLAANTLAATAGSLLVGFWLLEAVGLWGTFLVFAAVSSLPAMLALHDSSFRRPVAVGLATASFIAITHVVIDRYESARVEDGEEVVQRWEGPYGWIDVVRDADGLSLRENLHYRHGATGSSASFQYRQGHLPLLLHPDPREVLFLGLGTGLTAGAALLHPETERIEIVELIPEVTAAARQFREFNYDVLDDPRVAAHVGDARHHLVTTQRVYDVIVSDLFVPWMSKTGYLFTVEQFRAARARLKPEGLFCLWLGLYQVGATEFELIANSMASVFPETTVWWGSVSSGQARIALIGTEGPLTLDGGSLETRLRRLHRASQSRDLYIHSVPNLLRLYLGEWPATELRELNTDEHPRVEFLSPLAIGVADRLTGSVLSEYFEAVLARLPQSAVQFLPAKGQWVESREERHAAARSVLRRRSPAVQTKDNP